MKYIRPQSFSTAISFKLLPYLRLALIMVSGFILTNIGMKAFTQSALPRQSPLNTFLDYLDVFPGQPSDVLQSKAFSCYNPYAYDPPPNISCYIEPAAGIFSRIESTVLHGVIRQTTFTLRDDSLKVGNLVLLFDNPIFHAYPRKVFFFWNKLFAIVTTSAKGNPATMRPVWNVTFTDSY